MRHASVTHSSAAVFAAVADPTRRALLDLLRATGHQPAGRIADAFPVSRPAISRHLRVLRQARLVRVNRRGRHQLYELTPEPLRAVDNWLEWYRAFWRGKLDRLRTFAEQQHRRVPSRGRR